MSDEEEGEDEAPTVSGAMRIIDLQRKRWGGLVIFIGAIGVGLIAVAGIASAQTAAGVKNTNIRLEQQETALANHIREEFEKGLRTDKRIDRQDDAIEVINKKITLLLDEAGVPKWKRPAEVPPAPKDAGK